MLRSNKFKTHKGCKKRVRVTKNWVKIGRVGRNKYRTKRSARNLANRKGRMIKLHRSHMRQIRYLISL